MAERIAYLEAVVGADITAFRRGMSTIRNEMGILSETMQGVAAVGRTMTFTLTAPIVTLGTFAVQATTEFDTAMRNINAIAQLTETQFSNLKEEVMDFAKTTTAGVVPATEALYEIFSAGVTDVETAMATWETSIRVAEAGLASFDKTTNAVTATMAAYGLEAAQAAKVGDVWTHMVAMGVGSMEEFLANSQKVLPLSSALGISFEDLGATVAYLSQQGGGAKKAMTALAMLESNLLKPTQALEDAFGRLGVATGAELVAKFGSVSEAIIAIRETTDSDIDFAKMFSKTGLEAALSITNNIDRARTSIEEFGLAVDGATDRAWAEQTQSFAFGFERLKTAVQAAAITIGTQLMPLVMPVVDWLTRAFLALTELNPRVVQFGAVIATAVAAAGPILWLLGSLVSPIAAVSAAMAGLALAFVTNWDSISSTVRTSISNIVGSDVFAELESVWTDVQNALFPPEGATEFETNVANLIPTIDLGSEGYEFITVQPGDTLWEIFKEGGWDKIYSWEQFKDVSGLDNPGLLQPGDVIRIPKNLGATIMAELSAAFSGGTNTNIDLAEMQAQGFVTQTSGTNPVADSLLTRLQEAANIVISRIGPLLDPIMTNIATWFSDRIGAGLLNLSLLFEEGDGSGETGVYNAVFNLLNGDISAAIDAVIPGLGTKISDMVLGWSTSISENTGGLQKGAQLLFSALGTWIETEALPTVARSIGFFAGKLTLALNSAISSVWSALTGEEGAAAGNAINDAIVTPLSEGYQEALDGAELGGVDRFFTAIETALIGGAAAWVVAPGVVSAIAGALGRAFSLVTFTRAQVLPFLLRLTLPLRTAIAGTALFQATANAIGMAILNARIAVGAAARGFMTMIGSAIMAQGISISAGTAWVSATAGSIVSAIGGAMATGMGAIKVAIAGLSTTLAGAVVPILAVAGGLLIMHNRLQELASELDTVAEYGTEVVVDNVDFTIEDPETLKQRLKDQLFADIAASAGGGIQGDITARLQFGSGILGLERRIDEMVDAAVLQQQGQAIPDGMAAGVALGVPGLEAEVTAMGQAVIDGTATTLETGSPSQVFARFGQYVIDGFIQGLKTNTEMLTNTAAGLFGPESPMQTEMVGLRLAVNTEVMGIGSELETLGTIGAEKLGVAVKQIKPHTMALVDEIAKITDAAADAAAAMASLETNAGVGGTAIDGARAAGGNILGSGTYLVGEEGPELIRTGISGSVVPSDMLFGSGKSEESSQPSVVNIYGVTDVDKIEYEFKRRGIILR